MLGLKKSGLIWRVILQAQEIGLWLCIILPPFPIGFWPGEESEVEESCD